jgi:hypothetical protein
LLLAAAAAAQDAPAARLLKMISVRELVTAAPEPPGLPLGILCGGFVDRRNVSLFARNEPDPLLDESKLVDLLRTGTRGADVDSLVETRGGTLFLRGPADGVRAVEATLRRVANSFHHPLRVTAELYRLPADARVPPVLGRERGEALRGATRTWSATALVRSGELADLGQHEHAGYVARVDSEVAQESRIGVPHVARLFEGIGVQVEPHVLAGTTDLVLYCQMAFGEQRAPMASCQTGMEDQPSVDQPQLDALSGSFSGRIEAGGALVLALRAPRDVGPSLALVVGAEALAAANQDGFEPGVLPIGALQSMALSQPVTPAAEPIDVGENEAPDLPNVLDVGEEGEVLFESDAVHALVQGSIGDDNLQIETVGQHLLVGGKVDETLKLLRHVQDQWLQTARVEATLVREAEGANEPAGGQFSLTFPALLRRQHVVVAGRETTALSSYCVEIAQKSAMSTPNSVPLFSGVVVRLHAYPAVRGLGADAVVDWTQSPPPRRRPRETKDGSDIYLGRVQRARFAHHGPLPPNGELAFGEGFPWIVEQTRSRTRHALRVTLP